MAILLGGLAGAAGAQEPKQFIFAWPLDQAAL